MINIKTKSRRFKVIGGGLLLLSFIIQNFAYDYWEKESDDYYNANRDFSAMSRSSLLYLNLYFNADLEDKTLETILKKQYINMAAQKIAMGKTIEILIRDIEKKEQYDLSNSLLQNTKSVTDINTYLNYISFVNQIDTFDIQDNYKSIKIIVDRKKSFRWIFLGAYVLGSILLLLGLKDEC